MGIYINVGNSGFRRARNSEYVDKSELITVINNSLSTEHCFSCVSRCRRFGKSMAAHMLCAYYDQSCDSRALFEDLRIAQDADFEKHLNKYPTIFLDLSDFVSRYKSENIVRQLNEKITVDIQAAYPDVPVMRDDDLMDYLTRIAAAKHVQFIFIIDEWDAICRESETGAAAMDEYVNWLRRLFKGGQTAQVFAGAYLTGILPIKKYKTESALNNFTEYSMINPGQLAGYYGFTRNEVQTLCLKHGADFDELEKWYDGYKIGDEPSVFNPNSVMQAIWGKKCRSYWANTGAYDAVSSYVQMNFEGLKDDIVRMLSGERCKVNPTGFQNDMSVIRGKNDVLTILVHLGYLAYDWDCDECYIPNREVEGEMVNAVKDTGWRHIIEAINDSQAILQAVFDGDEQTVAKGVDKAHDENTSILSYNNENSLSCVLSLAFYYAKNDYTFHRELPTGKGFADIALMPRKNSCKPPILLELKYDKSADTAIEQIYRKEYQGKIMQYGEKIILVGINYDSRSKKHECKIECYQ